MRSTNRSSSQPATTSQPTRRCRRRQCGEFWCGGIFNVSQNRVGGRLGLRRRLHRLRIFARKTKTNPTGHQHLAGYSNLGLFIAECVYVKWHLHIVIYSPSFQCSSSYGKRMEFLHACGRQFIVLPRKISISIYRRSFVVILSPFYLVYVLNYLWNKNTGWMCFMFSEDHLKKQFRCPILVVTVIWIFFKRVLIQCIHNRFNLVPWNFSMLPR